MEKWKRSAEFMSKLIIDMARGIEERWGKEGLEFIRGIFYQAGKDAAEYCINFLDIKERVEYIDEEKKEVKLSADYCPIVCIVRSWEDCPRIGFPISGQFSIRSIQK
ncbi:MAG: hypothetical protein ACXQT5_08140 [Candidatus Syntropharchaeia archaeon]